MVTQAAVQVLARLLSQVASKELPDTSENVVRPHPARETAEAGGSQPMGRSVWEPAPPLTVPGHSLSSHRQPHSSC